MGEEPHVTVTISRTSSVGDLGTTVSISVTGTGDSEPVRSVVKEALDRIFTKETQ